jgi:hypothetical protein
MLTIHWLVPLPRGRAYYSITPLRLRRMRRETNPNLGPSPNAAFVGRGMPLTIG